ncbi:MAG: hypothetical protein PVJ76_12105 [Gemmatimonadota bacterium]|jgi:hypothetical protein
MGTKNRSVGRLALEGILIVASILIAFLLDAWWEEREAQHRLDQELTSVAREVAENRDLVEYEVDTLERIRAGSEAILALLTGAPTPGSVPVPDTLMFCVTYWSPTLDLSFGALDALISSGRLAQIRNPDLRLTLAGLRDRVADAVGDELLAQNILMEQVYPAVSKHADLSVVYRIDQRFGIGDLARETDQPIPSFGDFITIPGTPDVINAILNRTSWLGTGLGEMRLVLSHLDSLNTMIESGVR